ncbi:hypothetical protein FISHEDRAFT_61586 [Fistulina hepatica ATCC 64428]|uniref:Uncharacterized protein n=1 Tax=Fistulina hepatica ATCC 64428 TaxID=1128425 RepID=A0A0D7A280_9AGAR|nr:hypothetical protein FISHEDRAFT_61586 [Fistulina hepatica ATCC 64428]
MDTDSTLPPTLASAPSPSSSVSERDVEPNGDSGDRECSVRGCSKRVPATSTNKMCESCRIKHRRYASTKRARRRQEKAALNGHVVGDVDDVVENVWHARAPAGAAVTPPDIALASQNPHAWDDAIDPVLYVTSSSSELAGALGGPPYSAATQPSTSASVMHASSLPQEPNESSDRKCCSVKGCKNLLPDTYTFKMCALCRDRYRSYGVTKRAKWKSERDTFERELTALRIAEDTRRLANGQPPLAECPAELQAWEIAIIDDQITIPDSVLANLPPSALSALKTNPDGARLLSAISNDNSRNKVKPQTPAQLVSKENESVEQPVATADSGSSVAQDSGNAASSGPSIACKHLDPPVQHALDLLLRPRICTVSNCHALLSGSYLYKRWVYGHMCLRCEKHRLKSRPHGRLKSSRDKSFKVTGPTPDEPLTSSAADPPVSTVSRGFVANGQDDDDGQSVVEPPTDHVNIPPQPAMSAAAAVPTPADHVPSPAPAEDAPSMGIPRQRRPKRIRQEMIADGKSAGHPATSDSTSTVTSTVASSMNQTTKTGANDPAFAATAELMQGRKKLQNYRCSELNCCNLIVPGVRWRLCDLCRARDPALRRERKETEVRKRLERGDGMSSAGMASDVPSTSAVGSPAEHGPAPGTTVQTDPPVQQANTGESTDAHAASSSDALFPVKSRGRKRAADQTTVAELQGLPTDKSSSDTSILDKTTSTKATFTPAVPVPESFVYNPNHAWSSYDATMRASAKGRAEDPPSPFPSPYPPPTGTYPCGYPPPSSSTNVYPYYPYQYPYYGSYYVPGSTSHPGQALYGSAYSGYSYPYSSYNYPAPQPSPYMTMTAGGPPPSGPAKYIAPQQQGYGSYQGYGYGYSTPNSGAASASAPPATSSQTSHASVGDQSFINYDPDVSVFFFVLYAQLHGRAPLVFQGPKRKRRKYNNETINTNTSSGRSCEGHPSHPPRISTTAAEPPDSVSLRGYTMSWGNNAHMSSFPVSPGPVPPPPPPPAPSYGASPCYPTHSASSYGVPYTTVSPPGATYPGMAPFQPTSAYPGSQYAATSSYYASTPSYPGTLARQNAAYPTAPSFSSSFAGPLPAHASGHWNNATDSQPPRLKEVTATASTPSSTVTLPSDKRSKPENSSPKQAQAQTKDRDQAGQAVAPLISASCLIPETAFMTGVAPATETTSSSASGETPAKNSDASSSAELHEIVQPSEPSASMQCSPSVASVSSDAMAVVEISVPTASKEESISVPNIAAPLIATPALPPVVQYPVSNSQVGSPSGARASNCVVLTLRK